MVKHSTISGYGTYAEEDIPANVLLKTLAGELIVTDDIDNEAKARGLRQEDPLQIDDNKFLILEYSSVVINHACDPNCGLRNSSDLYTLRSIKAGEEITYDYSTTCVDDPGNGMHMLCNCGSNYCRKLIKGFETIPKEILVKYLKLDALPYFIRKRAKILELS